jgi:hypothetical protein
MIKRRTNPFAPTIAQMVTASRAGRDLHAIGVVAVAEAPHRVGGWFVTFADGREVHSDFLQSRTHNTLAAMAAMAA